VALFQQTMAQPRITTHLSHTHRNATIRQMLRAAVIDRMGEPNSEMVMCTAEKMVVKKVRDVPKSVAKMLKIPNKVPYTETAQVDEKNRSILMETRIKIKGYTLEVSTLYQEITLGQIDVKSTLICGGISETGVLRAILNTVVETQFKEGRHLEAVALVAM
jgi:hypothetical protein